MMTQRISSMDWMLKDLAAGVPQTRHVIVLSADGLCVAQYGAETDTADRLAAACAGLQSLAGAVAAELPRSEGRMRLVVIEMDGGFFYLMAARRQLLPRGPRRRGRGRGPDGRADAQPGDPNGGPPEQPAPA